jgi:hypothetical protein
MLGKAALFGLGKVEVLVSRLIGSTFANMNNGGSQSVAYDGITSQTWSASVRRNNTGPGYVGKSYPSAFVFGKAILYPSNNEGFTTDANVELRIYGKNGSNPSGATDGTLLATTGTIADTLSPVTLVTTDTVNSYDRIWAYNSGNNPAFSEIELYELKEP